MIYEKTEPGQCSVQSYPIIILFDKCVDYVLDVKNSSVKGWINPESLATIKNLKFLEQESSMKLARATDNISKLF